MKEEKLDKLSDEALDEVTGGWGDGTVVVTCTLCREGQAAVSQTGLWDAVCPKCGATIISEDGRVQFCFPQKSSRRIRMTRTTVGCKRRERSRL